MVSCIACGRSKTKKTKANNISFHRFPKDKNRRSTWMRFVNKDSVPSMRFLCSLHFSQDSFDRTSCSVVRLRDFAIPTIKVSRLKFAKTFENEVLEEESTAEPLPSTSSTVLKQTAHLETTGVNYQTEQTDSPHKIALKKKLKEYWEINILQSKQIRHLQKKSWNQKKRIESLSSLILELKENNDNDQWFPNSFGPWTPFDSQNLPTYPFHSQNFPMDPG